jgi:hypothetical protein
MEEKRSSLSDLKEAGAARQLLKAEVATREALDEVRETSRALRQRISEARAHRSSARRAFAVDRSMPRLPRAVPLEAVVFFS